MKKYFVPLLLLAAQSLPASAEENGASTGQRILAAEKNGRITFSAPDGDFSIALRALIQFDIASYGSNKTVAPFSSGSNFRRARLGLSGTALHDWSYEFLTDLGGSGTGSAAISSAWLQYDGLGPLHLRIGAYAPPESFDDSTATTDLTFLERAQPADLARGIAGSDGREAVTLYAYDDQYFAALSLTGGTTSDAAAWREQEALVGRYAWRLWHDGDSSIALGVDSTYVLQAAGNMAGPGVQPVRLRERPELNVDSQNIRLVDTGNIDAGHVVEWGAETAGNWHSLYGQGGYFGYTVVRPAGTLPDPVFGGWYAQASWTLTREVRPWRSERGAYGMPLPAQDFAPDAGGFGAWEIAARYSDLDLNDRQGIAATATPLDGIRGGAQRIWTIGLNWYPGPALRFLADYQHTDVSRLNAAGNNAGARLDAVSLRTQIAF